MASDEATTSSSDPDSGDPDYVPETWEGFVKGLLKNSTEILIFDPDEPTSARRTRMGAATNPALQTYDAEHVRFYNGLSREKKRRIDELETAIAATGGLAVPRRFQLLESGAPPHITSAVMAKVDALFRSDSQPSERHKMGKWLDAFLRLPFGVSRSMPVTRGSPAAEVRDFMQATKARMDSNIYGHADAKDQIIRTLAKWISNPQSRGTVLGIQGPMGCGKTTLAKRCIADALGLPLALIPLGGVTDSSTLTGHMYTYEGSTYGAVVSSLITTGCMNPVLLLDELDKVGGENNRGQEVCNVLIHLTDPVQNENFVDHYFADVPIDTSKALVVCTFNDEDKISPILRDRMTIIRTSGYKLEEKVTIAREHLLPRINAQHGYEGDGITVSPAAVKAIVARVEPESGVRNLERALDGIVGNINLKRVIGGGAEAEATHIDRALVEQFVPIRKTECNASVSHIYV